MNIDVALRAKLIGLTVEEAKKIVPYEIRVTKENGKSYMVTMDFKTNRVNVEINNDLITEVTGIG